MTIVDYLIIATLGMAAIAFLAICYGYKVTFDYNKLADEKEGDYGPFIGSSDVKKDENWSPFE